MDARSIEALKNQTIRELIVTAYELADCELDDMMYQAMELRLELTLKRIEHIRVAELSL